MVITRQIERERGQVVVIFALLLPIFLGLGAIVIGVGNWYTHAKHLQTKVDAGALAGGSAWSFPCGVDSDTTATGTGIVDVARQYVGPHTTAGGTVLTGGFNPQVGGVRANNVHAIINGTGWWDDDAGTNPPDFTTPSGSVCESMILDVRATEANSFPLFSLIPLFPDIKRKARVQIEEVEGVRGLLPIAVRVPKPLSTAAVFYNEQTGAILGEVRFFREVCQPPPGVTTCILGAPPGLGQWTTDDGSGTKANWTNFPVAETTGVVIATSFRPACIVDPAPPCFGTGFATVNSLCNQPPGHVQCNYATGSGASQITRSGLQFIRGYQTGVNVGNGPPELLGAWLRPGSCGSAAGSAYFNSVTSSCTATLNVNVDVGTGLGRSGNTQVRYKMISGNTTDNANDPPGPCGSTYGGGCDLPGPGFSTAVTFDPQYARHAIAIRVRLTNPATVGAPGPGQINCNASGSNCEWFFISSGRSTSPVTDPNIFTHPVQRSFMGNLDRSGAVKWLRLSTDVGCDNPSNVPDFTTDDGRAASLPSGNHCSYVEMGLQGGLAKDQDEPPIELNIGATSQSSVLDCDDDPTLNLRDEIQFGCQNPAYAANKFTTNPLCPGSNQFFNTPKPAPFDVDYPPWRCVLTQTSNNPNQVTQGLNLRIFGVQNNPSCPADPGNTTGLEWTKGRNYWHNANNQNDNYTFADNRVPYGAPDPNPLDNLKNRLKAAEDDGRLVTLFFTTYDSFTGNGNQTYPVVAFGAFYITGYGRVSGNNTLTIEDPCATGNNGNLYDGTGNEPPPDLIMNGPNVIAWGHFVKVVPANTSGGSGVLCQPLVSFQPCVPVLVE